MHKARSIFAIAALALVAAAPALSRAEVVEPDGQVSTLDSAQDANDYPQIVMLQKDKGKIKNNPKKTQICPDGSVISITDTCPPPATQTCPDGSVILATDTCPTPPATQTCWDGSVILATDVCSAPPATQTCPDGSVILATDVCPAPPPPPPTQGRLILKMLPMQGYQGLFEASA